MERDLVDGWNESYGLAIADIWGLNEMEWRVRWMESGRFFGKWICRVNGAGSVVYARASLQRVIFQFLFSVPPSRDCERRNFENLFFSPKLSRQFFIIHLQISKNLLIINRQGIKSPLKTCLSPSFDVIIHQRNNTLHHQATLSPLIEKNKSKNSSSIETKPTH